MQKLIPKRIVHILIFGFLLSLIIFLVVGPPGTEQDDKRIVFTEADVAQVIAKFMRTWNRPPNEDELTKGFQKYVRDEVLYREALARDLDQYDPKVRMALIQKITTMGALAAENAEYSDEDIDAFFALRKERYKTLARFSFMQVYINPDQKESDIKRKSEKYLTQLEKEDPTIEEIYNYGDPTMQERFFTDLSETEIERYFGNEFVTNLIDKQVGAWIGPIKSGVGFHLVKITNREQSRIPEIKEVLNKVLVDMRYENRKAAEDQFYAEIAPLYQVQYDATALSVMEGETD